MINDNLSPMSPLAVQQAYLHAASSESLMDHRQPGKRQKVNNSNGNDRGMGKDAVDKTRFLTLMTGFK